MQRATILIFAIVVGIALFVLSRADRRISKDIAALRTDLEALRGALETAEPQVVTSPPTPELLRLRADVTRLSEEARRHKDSVTNVSLSNESSFSRLISPSEWTNRGSAEPKAAAETLFWFLTAAGPGGDPVELIMSAPSMMRFEGSADLNAYPNLFTNLAGLLLTNPTQITGIQIGQATRRGSSEAPSDQVLDVLIHQGGQTRTQSLIFAPNFVGGKRNPDGSREPVGWSARVSVNVSDGWLTTGFR